MFEYTLSKRFFAVCLLLVLAVSCTLTALADAEPPGESSAPESSAASDASPQPEETPPPSAEPGPSESPAPAETPVPTETPPLEETPAPTETPPPEETPAPTETLPPSETPVPTAFPTITPAPVVTPAPTEEPEPEYTLDGALDFLAENGISLMAASASAVDVGTDVIVPNFPGMHRVYLGRSVANSAMRVDVSQILPELYSRLTVDNFCTVPVAFSRVTSVAASSGSFSYNSDSGLLSCPYLYATSASYNGVLLFDVYCYYNDSLSDAPVSGGVTSRSACKDAVGTDIEFVSFPGLHRVYLGNKISRSTFTYDTSVSFSDLYSSFTLDNFCLAPFSSVLDSSSSSGIGPAPSFNSSTGVFTSPAFRCFVRTASTGSSSTTGMLAVFGYDVYLFYNEASEMVLPEPDPTPSPVPSPTPAPGDTPVSAPHPFWTTPFADYSVTEGMLLLLFSLLSLFAVTKVFRR